MKEAIGTSFVFNLIMIFVGVMIALLVGSLAYTKGFKIRNRIIDIIQKHDGYTEQAKTEIVQNLRDIGYQISKDYSCKERDKAVIIDKEDNYHYCVYQYNTTKGEYYGITVFIHIDFPFIGDWVEIPVYGETRILFDKGTVTG